MISRPRSILATAALAFSLSIATMGTAEPRAAAGVFDDLCDFFMGTSPFATARFKKALASEAPRLGELSGEEIAAAERLYRTTRSEGFVKSILFTTRAPRASLKALLDWNADQIIPIMDNPSFDPRRLVPFRDAEGARQKWAELSTQWGWTASFRRGRPGQEAALVEIDLGKKNIRFEPSETLDPLPLLAVEAIVHAYSLRLIDSNASRVRWWINQHYKGRAAPSEVETLLGVKDALLAKLEVYDALVARNPMFMTQTWEKIRLARDPRAQILLLMAGLPGIDPGIDPAVVAEIADIDLVQLTQSLRTIPLIRHEL